jgi:ADP-ribose pyrophosphatase
MCSARIAREAGLSAQRWDHLGAIVTIPSFCDERIDLFLARDLSPSTAQLDFDEVIMLDRIDLEQALGMVAAGEIIDAKTIAALHHAHSFLKSANECK